MANNPLKEASTDESLANILRNKSEPKFTGGSEQGPKLMGIVNVTPDSFYPGSRTPGLEGSLRRIHSLVAAGADWLDIGAESTRPGAGQIPEEEELLRLRPLLEELRRHPTIPFSIDTRKGAVAAYAVECGAAMINDVEGFADEAMQAAAASCAAAHTLLCVMHMQADPATMQANPHYPEGIISHLLSWFTQRIELLQRRGIAKERIVLDPGIGFGKTVDDNLEILHNLHKLRGLGFPLLLGLSRKSFMQKILQKSSEDLLPATLAMNSIALLAGTAFLRVHDVAEHRQLIDMLTYYQNHAL